MSKYFLKYIFVPENQNFIYNRTTYKFFRVEASLSGLIKAFFHKTFVFQGQNNSY
ncbi:unnamed protein product [Paramecium sonneborni]|uniref:Uncharacterized protein n=1 Tax=Paramecium sonneborni TaxID=65129 RepID=A0A8S1P7S2_9CILI|nr:unnamed protein product [Paramecium sonneborni]